MKSNEEIQLALKNQLALVPNPTGLIVYTEFISEDLVKQVQEMVRQLQATPAITDQATAQNVNNVLGQAKRLITRVEDAALEMRRPLKAIGDQMRSNEKNVLASLGSLVEIVNKSITDFQIAEDRRQREEQERIRKQEAERLRLEQERIAAIKTLMQQVQTNVMTGLSSSEDIEDLKAKKEKLSKLTFNPEKYQEFMSEMEGRRATWLELFYEKITRLHEIKEELINDGVDEAAAIAKLKQNEALDISKQERELDKTFAESTNNAAANIQMTAELRTSVVAGAASVKRQMKYIGVINLDLVPRQYLMVNEAAIKAAIKGGVVEIPGVQIDEVISNVSR